MTSKKTRIVHSPEFKAAKTGTSTSQREKDLVLEVAKLKRQLAEQVEELDIIKNVWSAPFLQVKARCQNTFVSMYPACL
ncbi:hypothetical protein XM72_c20695 [Vibrio vulnificus]|nr:hypothetical protein XM72_c20695 [Vibrio vulnificus]POB94579.1 hypothetical protein CRN41_17940 [Vibrio vulnificus]